MTDAENSDDERYANESFENESDTELPEMSEFESESTENSEKEDDDDENLPSVKINTGPIQRKSYPNNFASINKTDVVPFDSSSEDENEVIVGQTFAEINTSSMIFEDQPPIPSTHQVNEFEEPKESSDEISEEEEEDEEEELEKIKNMEERYLQQTSTKSRTSNIMHTESVEEKEQTITDEEPENENAATNETEAEDEAEEEEEYIFEDENPLTYQEENFQGNNFGEISFNASCSSGSQETSKDGALIDSLDETKLTKLIENSLMNLNIISSNNNEDNLTEFCEASLLNEIKTQGLDAANIIDPDKLALAVLTALKTAGLKEFVEKQNLQDLENSAKLTKYAAETGEEAKKPTIEINSKGNNNNNKNKNNSSESTESEIVPYKDNLEEGRNDEIEQIQSNNNYDCNDNYIYYEAHITSKTPSSFNSDDYVFHANLIKQIHRTSSADKLRPKPYPRKSMSFSNERMREIERHNQILLRKILTKKPTYALKSKSSQSSLEKLPSQTNTRLTASAVNRKKQQRQIDLDNQVLKRKIEAIALRRRNFIT